jgi:protein-tyrosine phosphatase
MRRDVRDTRSLINIAIMCAASQAPENPWIDLDGADNVRDLGGLPTRDGRRTRSRRLLRSGTVQELTREAVTYLVEGIGLRTVVDLRMPAEAEREGSALSGVDGVRYLSLPVRAADRIRSDAVADVREMDVVDHYVSYLVGSPSTIVAAAREFCLADNLPALFHCAAGKDRTGVLAAIVLDAVGVETSAIIADYALTAERIDAIRSRLRRLETYREMQAVIARSGGWMSADGAEMARFLVVLTERYGGGAAYLAAHGMTNDELADLTAALVGPPGRG